MRTALVALGAFLMGVFTALCVVLAAVYCTADDGTEVLEDNDEWMMEARDFVGAYVPFERTAPR